MDEGQALQVSSRLTGANRAASAGVGSLFRSGTIASIVTFITARRIEQVQVAELERELGRQAVSRGAIENALCILAKANLISISISGRNRVCEVRRPEVWVKLGELFGLELGSSSEQPAGMPWLAAVVNDRPRRAGFKSRQPEPEPPDTARVETMLAKLPPVEAPRPAHRSSAPGRRR